VTVDRTAHLSRYADTRGANPGSLPRWEPVAAYDRFVTHHVNSKKVPVWVKGLEAQRILDHYEWVEIGDDHQFHSSSYAMLAREVPAGSAAPLIGVRGAVRGSAATPEQPPIPAWVAQAPRR
jgi:hypothetical protein